MCFSSHLRDEVVGHLRDTILGAENLNWDRAGIIIKDQATGLTLSVFETLGMMAPAKP